MRSRISSIPTVLGGHWKEIGHVEKRGVQLGVEMTKQEGNKLRG